LSYHGGKHYNAVVPQEWCVAKAFLTEDPGVIED